jgi:hypothetical protein
VGSTTFGLTISSSPGAAPGVFAICAAPAAGALVLGFTPWVDPTSPTYFAAVPAGGTIPLPLPSDFSAIGQAGYAQAFFADAGAPFGLAATSGVEIVML